MDHLRYSLPNSMMPFSQTSLWRFADQLKPPRTVTLKPSVTSGSVLGMVFNNGVVMCSDMLGSYGSLARYPNCDRLVRVNDCVLLGAGGDFADFQFISDVAELMVVEEEDSMDDGFKVQPKEFFSYLTRSMYDRRNQMNPLWNNFVVGGIQDGRSPFLGMVNMTGTAVIYPIVATGLGRLLAQPMMEESYWRSPNMSELDAKKVLYECMRVLYYRDCRSSSKFKFGVVTAAGVKIEGPYGIDTTWYELQSYND